MRKHSEELGEAPITTLLVKQSVPAMIGIIVMSIYAMVDTIFVGQYVGALAIGAITVVFPITFLISAIGGAIGIGGASVISRALGAGNRAKAHHTFGNMAVLNIGLSVSIMFLFASLNEEIIQFFGGKGDLLEPSLVYFNILIYAVPFQAWAMMANNVIRAEGQAKIAMVSMFVPAFTNLILDAVFIIWLEWGIAGAAWASVFAYIGGGLFTFGYFLFKFSEIRFTWSGLLLKWELVKEIAAIGGVSLARQGTISVLTIVLNNTLYSYGGELSISIYGILQRIMFVSNSPILGITQGFLPIAGFNYGAQLWDRVKSVTRLSIRYGTLIALGLFTLVLIFAPQLTRMFTTDPTLLETAPSAIRIAYLATPLLTIQLIGAAYYQAIGKALPALLLTLCKQGFFLIPLILLLPPFFGVNGVWMSFPIADTMTATVSYIFLKKATKDLRNKNRV